MAVKRILMIETPVLSKNFESLIVLQVTVKENDKDKVYYRVKMSNGDTDTSIDYTKEEFHGIVNDLVSALL